MTTTEHDYTLTTLTDLPGDLRSVHAMRGDSRVLIVDRQAYKDRVAALTSQCRALIAAVRPMVAETNYLMGVLDHCEIGDDDECWVGWRELHKLIACDFTEATAPVALAWDGETFVGPLGGFASGTYDDNGAVPGDLIASGRDILRRLAPLAELLWMIVNEADAFQRGLEEARPQQSAGRVDEEDFAHWSDATGSGAIFQVLAALSDQIDHFTGSSGSLVITDLESMRQQVSGALGDGGA